VRLGKMRIQNWFWSRVSCEGISYIWLLFSGKHVVRKCQTLLLREIEKLEYVVVVFGVGKRKRREYASDF
jgi:hypothetical protein